MLLLPRLTTSPGPIECGAMFLQVREPAAMLSPLRLATSPGPIECGAMSCHVRLWSTTDALFTVFGAAMLVPAADADETLATATSVPRMVDAATIGVILLLYFTVKSPVE
jgi:hypothetical protein